MAIQVPNLVNAFLQGRQARSQMDQDERKNALLDMQLQNAPQEQAQQNKLLDLQVQGAQQDITSQQARDQSAQTAATDVRKQRAIGQLSGLARQALASANPRGLVSQAVSNPAYAEAFKDAGFDPSKLDMNSPTFEQDLQTWASLGDQVSANNRFDAEEAEKARKATASENAANRANQLAVAGMRNQPAPVGPPKLSPAEVKARIDIKNKAPRLVAAERRLDRIDTALTNIGKNWSFDGGPLDKYALQMMPEGQELQAAGAQFLAELTALTRVPGIGSQSDLEQRLQALQLPSTEFPPEVNQRNSAELRSFINDLKAAYQQPDIGEPSPGQAQGQTQPSGQRQAPPEAIEYLKANPQFRGAFQKKYGYLPGGASGQF